MTLPPRPHRLLLGLLAGLRPALIGKGEATFIVVLGIMILIGIIVSGVMLIDEVAELAELGIAPIYVWVNALVFWFFVFLYEQLRTLGALIERDPGPPAARMLAGLFLPSLLGIWLGGLYLRHGPHQAELLWPGLWVLCLGSFPAVINVSLRYLQTPSAKRKLATWLCFLPALLTGLGLLFWPSLRVSMLNSLGFSLLPSLLTP